jgi:integrase
MRANLTDSFAARATPGLYWDTHPKAPTGFALKVNPGGSRNYVLNYRLKDSGRERRLTIGDVASWPVAEARKRAAELRRVIDGGGDPLGDWQDKRAAPTVKELAARFVKEALPYQVKGGERAPRTQADYRDLLDRFIVPALGGIKVAAVTTDNVLKLHRQITAAGKKRRANAMRVVARLLFDAAIKWKMRDKGDNPVVEVPRNPEPGRERFLSDPEIDRLMAALEAWRIGDERDSVERLTGKRDSADMITLLLLTGARRGEVVGMRRGQLDLDAAVWDKPLPLVKQRRRHRVPLSPEAVALLRRRLVEREQDRVVALRDDRVFRGTAVVDRLERDWRVIRASAGLNDVRLHDLRHSYASLLAGSGLSLPIIGALLGHSQAQTTLRYAHLADQPLRAATGIVGKIVGNGGC